MFIERLNEALKRKKMSGNALCNKMEISNSIYTGWKKSNPSADKLKQIADILEVSVDWLLEREGAPDPDEVHLLENYRICDDDGKETITNIAELQAKRCKQDKLKPFA